MDDEVLCASSVSPWPPTRRTAHSPAILGRDVVTHEQETDDDLCPVNILDLDRIRLYESL